MNRSSKAGLRIIIAVLIAVLSVGVGSKLAMSPEFHRETIEALDTKKTAVTELAAAATATSVAVSAIPGETAEAVANELADLSTGFLIVIAAIYLEKYLITITGYISFGLLIPIACLLFAVNTFAKSSVYSNLIKKIIIFAVVIVCVVPASEKISGLIESTYEVSIRETIDSATQAVELQEDEEGGLSAIWNKVTEATTEVVDSVKNTLNNFVEALAVMIVTSCIIPVLVLLFFLWFIRFMLGVNINLPQFENFAGISNAIRKLHVKKEQRNE